MITWVRALSAVVMPLVVSVLFVGCFDKPAQTLKAEAGSQSTPPEAFPSPPTVMSHVRVAGAPADLKLFNDQMAQIEGVAHLEEAFIGCPKCELLGGNTPPPDLDYYYVVAHTSKPRKFVDAWSAVRTAGKKIALTFDDDLTNQTPGACPASPPAPVCFSAPWCTRTSQCDKSKTTSGCQLCQ